MRVGLLLSINHLRSAIGCRTIHRWVAPTLRCLKNKKERLPPRAPDPRKSFIEWNYEAELYAFGKRLGEQMDNNLLRVALTDQRYLEEEMEKRRQVGMEPEIQLSSNTDLIDSGHQIIEDYIDRFLNKSLPELPHNYIVKIKEYLMSEEILAEVSKHLGIDDILLVPEDVPNTQSLVEGLKAVIAAVQDQTRAERLVRDVVVSQLCGFDLTKLTTPDKPVQELQHRFEKEQRPLPEYRLIAESAVNTLLPVYHVGAYSDRVFLGRGFGETIPIAREMAACDTLWRLWGLARRKPFRIDNETFSSRQSPAIDITSSS